MPPKIEINSGTMPSVNENKLRATPSGLTFKEKIQLSKHRITNILAVLIVIFYLVTVVIQAWKGSIDIIQEVRVLVFVIVGYYFGRGIENGN
jgi:hypothetical protein